MSIPQILFAALILIGVWGVNSKGLTSRKRVFAEAEKRRALKK